MVGNRKGKHILESDEVIAIISDQFPQLNPQKVKLLGVGSDNIAYLINDELVFRFSRSSGAASFLKNEHSILPLIAPKLRLAIPIPLWFGQPTEIYPMPFSGYRIIEGIKATHVNFSVADRLKFVEPLASFLSALHSTPLTDEMKVQLPDDSLWWIKIEQFVDDVRKGLAELASLGLFEINKRLNEINDAVENIRFQKKSMLVHGDLYISHMIVNKDHQLTGVIDWGHIHLGDHAEDLAIAHLLLPVQAHQSFRSIYGGIYEETWRIARLRALYYCCYYAREGYHTKDQFLLSACLEALNLISEQDL